MEPNLNKRIKLDASQKVHITLPKVHFNSNKDESNSNAEKFSFVPFFELQEKYQFPLEIDDLMKEVARTLTIRYEEYPFPSDVVSQLNQKHWFIHLNRNDDDEVDTTGGCLLPFISNGSEWNEVQLQKYLSMCFHLVQALKYTSTLPYLMAQFVDSNQLNNLSMLNNLVNILIEFSLQPFLVSNSVRKESQSYMIFFKYQNEFYRYQVQNIRFGIIMACAQNVTSGKYEFQWVRPEVSTLPGLEFLPLFYYDSIHSIVDTQRNTPRRERMNALCLAYNSCRTQLNFLSTIACGYAILCTRSIQDNEIRIEVGVVSREDPLYTMSLYELSRVNFNDEETMMVLREQIEDFTVTMLNIQSFFRWYIVQLNDALQKEDHVHLQAKLRRHEAIVRQAKELGEI